MTNVKPLGNLRNPFVEILHRLLEYLVSTGSRAFVRLSDMNSFFDKITVFKLWKCFYNSVVLLWALLQASDGRSSLFAQRSSVKKVFLKISQNSHKTPMPKSLFLIMFHASMCHFPKKKDSEDIFSIEHLLCLLLFLYSQSLYIIRQVQ